MKTIEKSEDEEGLVPKYCGLTDKKRSYSLRDEMRDSLYKIFNYLKGEAETHASKVVQLNTGLVIQVMMTRLSYQVCI